MRLIVVTFCLLVLIAATIDPAWALPDPNPEPGFRRRLKKWRRKVVAAARRINDNAHKVKDVVRAAGTIAGTYAGVAALG